jgi:hypothetical protein
MMDAYQIANALGKAKPINGGYLASCPVESHGKGGGDKHPSLSLKFDGDKILVHCHAGCSQVQVIDQLKSKGLWSGSEDLPQFKSKQKPIKHPELGEPSQYWTYRDASGFIIGHVCRFQTQGGKEYRPYFRNDKGGFRWKFAKAPHPLFGLDALYRRSKARVLIVEGEKAAEAAKRLLPYWCVATSPCGAGAVSKADWRPMKGRTITIWPDADDVGLLYAEKVVECCFEIGAKSVSIVKPPSDVIKGWDAADALADGWTEEITEQFLKKAEPVKSQMKKLKPLNLDEFLALELPPKEMLLAPFLPVKGLVELYASRGIGKTYLALAIAYAVATGGELLRWEAPRSQKVLFVDGEMPAIDIQDRLRQIIGKTSKCEPEHLMTLSADMSENGFPDLYGFDGQNFISDFVEQHDIKLLILDNLSSLFRDGNENEADDWAKIQHWLLSLRRSGVSVLFVHHAGKSGKQRGTSRREDVVDTVLALKRPEEYDPSEGAKFVVHYEKNRGFCGDASKSFEVKMEITNNVAHWECSKVKPNTREQVIDLYKGGIAQCEIAETVGIHKSTVSRHIAAAKVNNLITPNSDLNGAI